MPKTAAKWIRSTADEMAVKAGCYFDERAAAHVVEFFAKYLRHSKGKWAGKPFELIPWQRDDVIYPLFGWMRADKTRRFRKSFIEIPKKNGKSTLAAGVGLYLLAGDGEKGAVVLSAASDRDQAGIVHGEAINMVKASDLQHVLKINHTSKAITHEKTMSEYRAVTGEGDANQGRNASGIIIDELHVWYGRNNWDSLRMAGRSRDQPLTFVITTAGDDPLSVCREQYDYAKGVLSGAVNDDRFFAYIREAEPNDDYMSPEVWKKANPSLGITINEEDFAADMLEASKTPSSLASTKRYSLNIWATATNPWLRIEDWNRCAEPFTADMLEGQTCHAGLDLAKTRDMTALVLIFRHEETGICRLLPYFWLPEAAVHDPDKPEEYRVWAREGLLEVTPGNVCDYTFITKRLVELKERFEIRELAFDPYNAEQLTQELETEHDLKRIAFPQTIQHFAEPTKEFERLILSRGLRHNDHPVLNWQAGNVSVRTDANGNIRPVKPPQGDPRKIDGIVAAIMGLARSMLDREELVEAGMFLIGGDD